MTEDKNTAENDTEEKGTPSFARRKRNRLTFLLVWTFFSGLLFGAMGTDDNELVFTILDAIVLTLVLIQWTLLDAEDLEFQLVQSFVPLVALCPGPLIVMPIYFVKTRGWRRGLAACAGAIGLLLLLVVIEIASSLLGAIFYFGF